MSKEQTNLGIEQQSEPPEVWYILWNNVNTWAEISNNFREVLGPILRYQPAQNQGVVNKTDNSHIEQQCHLPEVLYILKHNVNTSTEMNNNFIKVISPIFKYHHAQNQGYVEKTGESRIWTTI